MGSVHSEVRNVRSPEAGGRSKCELPVRGTGLVDSQENSCTVNGTRAEASEPHQNPTMLLSQSQIPASTTKKTKLFSL